MGAIAKFVSDVQTLVSLSGTDFGERPEWVSVRAWRGALALMKEVRASLTDAGVQRPEVTNDRQSERRCVSDGATRDALARLCRGFVDGCRIHGRRQARSRKDIWSRLKCVIWGQDDGLILSEDEALLSSRLLEPGPSV